MLIVRLRVEDSSYIVTGDSGHERRLKQQMPVHMLVYKKCRSASGTRNCALYCVRGVQLWVFDLYLSFAQLVVIVRDMLDFSK